MKSAVVVGIVTAVIMLAVAVTVTVVLVTRKDKPSEKDKPKPEPPARWEDVTITNVTDLIGTWCMRDIFYDADNCSKNFIASIEGLKTSAKINCTILGTDRIFHDGGGLNRTLVLGHANQDYYTNHLLLNDSSILIGPGDNGPQKIVGVKNVTADSDGTSSVWMLLESREVISGSQCHWSFVYRKVDDVHNGRNCSDVAVGTNEGWPLEEAFGPDLEGVGFEFSHSLVNCTGQGDN